MQIGTARRRFKVDKIDVQSYFISEAPYARYFPPRGPLIRNLKLLIVNAHGPEIVEKASRPIYYRSA